MSRTATASPKHSGAGVAGDPMGSWLVVWDSWGSYGTDASGFSVQGQRFATPIFSDGFEVGGFVDWIVFPSPVP